MSKKRSSNTLLIAVVGLLAALVALMLLQDSKKGKSSFKEEIVAIDTDAITAVYLYPQSNGGQEVKIAKDGTGNWTVTDETGATQPGDSAKINGLIGMIEMVKPERVVSKNKDKWAEYQVEGSEATRLKVMEGDKTTLDLFVGKFTVGQPKTPPGGGDPRQQMQQQQQRPELTSYVRLEGENEIYAVDGMLSFSFNQGASSFVQAPAEPIMEEAVDSTNVE
ncbi:MAG: DUF4340 domain-containing protein [Chitinophagales bacterium]